jgi:hypothetical protein
MRVRENSLITYNVIKKSHESSIDGSKGPIQRQGVCGEEVKDSKFSWDEWGDNHVADFAEGFILGDLKENPSAFNIAGQFVGGVIPGYGIIGDIRDTGVAISRVIDNKKGSWEGLGLALIGWIPLFGDFLKASRKATKTYSALADISTSAKVIASLEDEAYRRKNPCLK